MAKLKENKKEEKKEIKKDNSAVRWFITIFITTFVLSIFFSYISTNSIANLSIIPAIFILAFVVLIGIIFDIIGVAVTVANEHEFHAKATKKVEGSKTSIKLIRNSAKVANICADVVGDICGVISGSISALIAIKISQTLGVSSSIQYIISACVASLTVGGKALGKVVAQNNSTKIVHVVGTIINKVSKNGNLRKSEKNEVKVK